MTSTSSNLRIGTRGSALARWQADHIAALLRAAHPGLAVEIEILSTRGDRVLDTPLPLIGGKGVFTAELEAALHERRIDLAVHSLKDLPTTSPAGLTLAAVPERADPRDALVSRDKLALNALPRNAVVGTSSLRRIAQLRRLRPDLDLRDVRGNVDTRVRKVLELHEYDAILLACAGLDRLGLADKITSRLSPADLMPAPGQAALGLQTRDDAGLLQLLSPLNHTTTHLCVVAERAFLSALGGGCAVPVAAYATFAENLMTLQGRITAVDSRVQIEVTVSGRAEVVADAHSLGTQAAQQAIEQGAEALLARLGVHR